MANATCKAQNTTTCIESPILVGWTLESSGRGTLHVIVTCLATTALCTWVVIHPRLNRHKRLRVAHKFALLLKTILAPEFIAVEAAQEWTQARRTVNQSAKATNGHFHMIQAFYVGMFGLHYRTERGTKVIWPNQFVWLLNQGLLDWHRHDDLGLTKECIKDKSNADGLAKLFAIVQVAWFMAHSVIRATHHLPLSALESMTLGYIPIFAVTYFYWRIKPKDISTPSIIDLPAMDEDQKAIFESMAVDDAFDDEQTPSQLSWWSVWILTPRVFEKEAADKELQMAQQQYNRLKSEFESHVEACRTQECPDNAHLEPGVPSITKETGLGNWDPELYHSKLWPVACLVGVSFPALHLISWNTVFPTLIELWLWRASAIASIIGMLVFMQFRKVTVRWSDPLMLLKILSPGVELITRIIMVAIAFAAFRAPAIYETYVVSSY